MRGFNVAQETWPLENSPINKCCHIGSHVIISSMREDFHWRNLGSIRALASGNPFCNWSHCSIPLEFLIDAFLHYSLTWLAPNLRFKIPWPFHMWGSSSSSINILRSWGSFPLCLFSMPFVLKWMWKLRMGLSLAPCETTKWPLSDWGLKATLYDKFLLFHEG